MNCAVSLPQCVLEEIALEGLEGITTEGLWKRVGVRLKLPLPLNTKITTQIWAFVKSVQCLQFYVLPLEREPLKLFDRADFVDPIYGAPIEPESCPYNSFKYNPITTDMVRGSCENFDTREEISQSSVHSMSLQTIENKWGLRFVIVASQSLRSSMLIPSALPSDIELSISNYGILERLGRARYNGEVAHGKYSLADIAGDPVSFHNQKKKLLKYKLVECQPFNHHVDGQNTAGQLLHLPRFFAQFKPRHMIVMEKIIEYLKTKPNCMTEYQEVKDLFDVNLNGFLRRLFKSSFFLKFVLTDTRVPYRVVYPDADEKLWKKKKKETERMLHVLQLRNPNIDSGEFWSKTVENEDENDDVNNGFLGDSHEVLEMPLLHQVYEYIRSSKELGVSDPEIGAHFGQGKLGSRALVKNLKRLGGIEFYTSNNKRQQVRKYVLPEYNKRRKVAKVIDSGPSDDENDATDMKVEKSSSRLSLSQESAQPDTENVKMIGKLEQENVEMESIELAPATSKAEEDNDPNKYEEFEPFQNMHKMRIDENIETEIVEIDRTDYCMRSGRRELNEQVLSEKMKERLRFLQREIKSKKLIDDPSKLIMAMTNEERSRGFKDMMCRKTFFRLLSYLCKMKRIRLWRVEFKYKTKLRTLLYITNRNIDSSFSLMKSCIEQAKSKFRLNIYSEEYRRELMSMKKPMTKAIIPSAEQGPRLSLATNQTLNYGPRPKFVRLRTIHEFLFYLVYENRYENANPLDSEQMVERWKENKAITLNMNDFEGNGIPAIWSEEIGWKMFVPPLIKHNGFDDGWCLLSDCIFRMPLSIFVKVINIMYEIRGLDEFLSHPIKKHYLLKDLPMELQQTLYARRKYIGTIHELMKRMCCMGLAQAGPHRAVKDQAFYYINHMATLHDTISSEPGFNYVCEQKYPVKRYELNSLQDLNTYWDEMYRICMNTKLNRKSLSDGTTPADKVLPDHLLPYIKAVQPRQAKERDTGVLPGDHRGAAGLDATFFAHLERNWSLNVANYKPRPQPTLKTSATPIRYSRLVRITRDSNMQKREQRITPVPLYKLTKSVVRRRAPIVRKRTAAIGGAVKKRHRSKYDEIDRMALKQMSKLRVDWNSKEDNFLLLCKVAHMYLNPTSRPLMSSSVIRDLIHWHCKSLNKTSNACSRRTVYIMKKLANSRQINNSVLTCLGEIKENKSIQKRFGVGLVKNLKNLYPDEEAFGNAYKIHFIDLVHTLSCQYYNLTNSFESNALVLPNTIHEFREKFQEKSEIYDLNSIRYDEPKSSDDIKISTIITLIHSTMCSCYDKTSWSIQLYEVYKDFPEKLLSSAMQKVRSDHLISLNKMSHSLRKPNNRCLPLSASSYHLSVTYQQQMNTKISYELFEDAFAKLKQIIEDIRQRKKAHAMNTINSTACFFLTELLHKSFFDINIEVPKRILILDPAKQLPNDTFQGIYARFHEIFNYIPKVDLVEMDEAGESSVEKTLVASSLLSLPLPSTSDGKGCKGDEPSSLMKKLEKLTDRNLHFFCIVDHHGLSKPRSRLELNIEGKCPLNCLINLHNPMEHAMKSLLSKREVWSRLSADRQQVKPLPEIVEIDDFNIVAIYNYLLLKGVAPSEQQQLESIEKFKQVLDIVEEVLSENEKEDNDDAALLANDIDFGDEYDLKSDMKKKWYDGAQINEKIHKFHDFLYVNTCKLSLTPLETNELVDIDLNRLSKQRDDVLAEIVENANWSVEFKSNNEFVDQMSFAGFSQTEIHIGLDIYGFIESLGEMGATTALLKDKYEDTVFLRKVLDILVKIKLVMKTGICAITFVHWTHIKPWIVNTYHLKRLDREAIHPTTKSLMHISDSADTPNELKRKANNQSDTENDEQLLPPKQAKRDETPSCSAKAQESNSSVRASESSYEVLVTAIMLTRQDSISGNTPGNVESIQVDTDSSGSKLSKSLSKATIARGAELPPQAVPLTKKTFALKMAPWIRINGSINRRVLDKYLGTVLLYCIENMGLTLFKLCTRFHYLLPVHIRELVQYLEDYGCLAATAFVKRKPISLFSAYETLEIAPATDLDEFEDIIIEPTIDAVTKLSIFIGNKKYKEDFI